MKRTSFSAIAGAVAVILVIIIGGITSTSAQSAIKFVETPPSPPMQGNPGDWVIIDLPADATQLERGKEAYRLVCSACHAYDGSGLTDEWRATWNVEDQNCWQSKCHGYNHPEDGFYLPDSPPVVGSFVPQLFPTAQECLITFFLPCHGTTLAV